MLATVKQLRNALDRVLDKIAAVAQTASAAIGEVAETKADKAEIVDLTIPVDGWKNDGTASCPNYIDIKIDGLTAADCVSLTIPPESAETALEAGMTCTESREGVLRLRARKVPTAAMQASYYIVR